MKHKTFLLFLFLFSFFIRALVFDFFLSKNNNYFRYDSRRYHEVATQIALCNGIKNADGSIAFWRVPGYSLFLGFCYVLFDFNQKVAIWIQLFFASLLPILVFFLSLTMFPSRLTLAKISAIFSAFHLGFILFSSFMMAESIFCLFFFLFLIYFFKPFGCKHMFIAGVFLGLASMFRPVGLYLILVSIFILLFYKIAFIQKVKGILLLFGGWFLIIVWWLLRNYLLTGYLFLHTMTGAHLLFHVASPIDAYVKEIPPCTSSDRIMIDERSALFEKTEKEKGRPLHVIEQCLVSEKLAYSYVKKYPFVALKNAIYNIVKTCTSLYSSEILSTLGYYPPLCYEPERTFLKLMKRFLFPPVQNIFIRTVIFIEIIFLVCVLLSFLLFLLKAIFDKNLLFITLQFLPIMGVMIALTFASGIARLRLPIEPFFLISAFYWYKK
jgi:hypothetical protein